MGITITPRHTNPRQAAAGHTPPHASGCGDDGALSPDERPRRLRVRRSLAAAVVVITCGYTVAAVRDRGADADAAGRARGAAAVRAVLRGEAADRDGRAELDDVERLIAATAAQTATTPTSSGFDLLAQLQLTRGRVTGDAASYAAALDASARSLRLAPGSTASRSLSAEVHYANHEFGAAATDARAVLEARPGDLAALAVLADTARELGDDATATRLVADLTARAPASAPVTVRRARLAYLHGDPETASRLAAVAERQATSAGLNASAHAFYPAFSAQVAYDRGRYDDALDAWGRALAVAPGDRVASLGLARTLAAQGRADEARRVLRRITARFPDPLALTLLGDLESDAGDTTAAQDAYALVDAVTSIARSNRQIYNRELVLFALDHHADDAKRVAEALGMARAEFRVRKDVHGYDALAWAEYRSGHIDAADTAAREALRLGTRDAALRYHAGMIAVAAGDAVRGRTLLREALDISPHFDLRAARLAADTLRRLPE